MEAALSMLTQWLCTLFDYVNSGSPGLRAEEAPRSACTLPQSAPRTHGLLFLLPGTPSPARWLLSQAHWPPAICPASCRGMYPAPSLVNVLHSALPSAVILLSFRFHNFDMNLPGTALLFIFPASLKLGSP